MARSRWLALAVVIVCAFLSLSCITPCLSGISGRSVLGPQATAQPARPTQPPSQEAAKSFEEKAEALNDDTFNVEFTDSEVTSYIALQLGSSSPIAAPSVTFQPGKVMIEGDVTSPIQGHIKLVGTLQAVGGKPQLTLESANIAGIPIPASMLGSLSETLAQSIATSDSDVEIESIQLLEGRMIISGHKKS